MTAHDLSAPQGVSVAVVDDHRLLAESIAAGLASADGIRVVGIATTGSDGLGLVRAHHPDVCLLDQRLPDLLGTDLVPALLKASPTTRVLLVTASESDEVLRRALEVGCVGFLTKGEGVATLLDAVRRAADGEIVLTAADLRRLVPVQRFCAGQARLRPDATRARGARPADRGPTYGGHLGRPAPVAFDRTKSRPVDPDEARGAQQAGGRHHCASRGNPRSGLGLRA